MSMYDLKWVVVEIVNTICQHNLFSFFMLLLFNMAMQYLNNSLILFHVHHARLLIKYVHLLINCGIYKIIGFTIYKEK